MPPSEGHSRHAPKGGRTPHERSPLVSVATDAEETKDKEPARKPDRRGLITLVLVLLSAVMLFVSTTFELDDKHPKATEGLFIMLVTVMWFVSEVVPISIISLLPVVLYTVFDVTSASELASIFFNSTSFILVVGQFLSLAVVRWGLHQRVCVGVAAAMGHRVETLVLGFMLSAWFLSMWISNTATTLSLLPAAQAFLADVPSEGHGNFHPAFLLAIAFSATVGGIATPVGTPPNAIFMQQMHSFWPKEDGVSFLSFMAAALPLSLLLLSLVWLGFCVGFVWSAPHRVVVNRQMFIDRREALGPLSYEEYAVLFDLILLIGLWFTAAPINDFKGWAAELAPGMDIGAIGIMCTLPLFIIPCGATLPPAIQRLLGPSRCTSAAAEREPVPPRCLLDWAAIRARFNFDLLLCLGGANMIGQGTVQSGLAAIIANQLAQVQGPNVVFVTTILLVTSLTTEFVSNAATMGILGPVVAAAAAASGHDAVHVLMAACFASSFSFALPTATGPNIVVYGTGLISVPFLLKLGVMLELGALFIGTLWIAYALPVIIGPSTDYGPPEIEPRESFSAMAFRSS